MSSIMYQ